jgi:hypothetical protein
VELVKAARVEQRAPLSFPAQIYLRVSLLI